MKEFQKGSPVYIIATKGTGFDLEEKDSFPFGCKRTITVNLVGFQKGTEFDLEEEDGTVIMGDYRIVPRQSTLSELLWVQDEGKLKCRWMFEDDGKTDMKLTPVITNKTLKTRMSGERKK